MDLTTVIKNLWCDLTHGGGEIRRDLDWKINWQCKKCGRWADPVETKTEQAVIEYDIRKHGLE